MSDALPFNSVEEFFFNSPLYATYNVTRGQLNCIVGTKRDVIDGFCPTCDQKTPFFISGTIHSDIETHTTEGLRVMNFIDPIELLCMRRNNHKIHVYLHVKGLTVRKIGQLPSLADIANDESKTYRGVLTKQDSHEFHKAIGLAAHGVGIGCFVYFRRIFERLINSRFQEFKTAERWSDEEFASKRMSERVIFLKDHLPPFLVENHKIYSILSLGIHELDEDQCLRFFPVLKASIVLILDEDKKKKQELALRASLKQAIAEFAPEPVATGGEK